MIGVVGSALALSAALLIPGPRRRLGSHTPAAGKAGRRIGLPAAAGCAIGCLVAVFAVVLPLTTDLAAVSLGATIGVRHRRRVRDRRGIDEARALATALDVLVGELRIGAHPVLAFEVAAAETGHTGVAAALGAVAARARLGADVAAGLRSVAGSSSRPVHWQRLALYWRLGTEHGLAISTLMHAAQRDLVERQRFSEQVQSGLAGARASAAILGGLPVLGVALGQLIGAGPVSFLLSGRGAGLLLAGVVLVCVGLLWSDRITGPLT